MSISVACSSCNGKFKAPDKAAGRSKNCPQCGVPLVIPISSEPTTTVITKAVEADPVTETSNKASDTPIATVSTAASVNPRAEVPTGESTPKQKMTLEEAVGPLFSPLIPLFSKSPLRFGLVTAAGFLALILIVYNLSQVNWTGVFPVAKSTGKSLKGTTKKEAEEILQMFLESWKRDDMDGLKRKFPEINAVYSTSLRIDGYTIQDGWAEKGGVSYQFVVWISYRHGGGDKVHISVLFYNGKVTIGYGQ